MLHKFSLTSAVIKAYVLNPPKKPTKADTRKRKPDNAKMQANNPKSLTWLQTGVVGENDN